VTWKSCLIQQRWLEKHERSSSCGNLHAIDQMIRGPRCYILSGMPQRIILIWWLRPLFFLHGPMHQAHVSFFRVDRNYCYEISRLDHMSRRPVGPVVSGISLCSGTPHATWKKKHGCIKTFQISPTAEINSSTYSCRYIEPIPNYQCLAAAMNHACQEQGCATRLPSYYCASIQNQVHALVFVDF
jgi:hypothetical protein